MKTLKFSFLFYTLFLIIGIFLYDYIPFVIALLCMGGAIFFIALSYKNKFTFYPTKFSFISDVIAIGLLFISLGVSIKKGQEFVFNKVNTNEFVAGFVKQSVKADVRIEEEVSSSSGKRYIVQLLRINDSVVHTKAYLTLKEQETSFIPGDIISTYTFIRTIEAPRNIGQFDYQSYSKQQGIYFQLYGSEFVRVARANGLKYEILRWRFYLTEQVKNSDVLSNNAKGLLNALILGKRSDIDKVVLAQFKELGVMHILAISGLHVGLIYLMLLTAFGFLKPISKQVVVVLLLWLFVFLSGFSPSVFRAVFMFTIFSVARIIRREQSLEHNVGLALFFSLFFYPNWVTDIGFQLSYLAVVSIVYILPLFANWYSTNRIVKYIQGIVYVSLSVQVGLMAIQLYYFKQFSLLFLIGNLIVIPFVTVLIVLGVLYFMTLFIPFLNQLIGIVFNLLTDMMYKSVSLLAQFDEMVIKNVQFSKTQVFVLLTLLTCLLLFYYRKSRVWVLSSFVLFFTLQVVPYLTRYSEDKRSELIIPYSQNREQISLWYKKGSHLLNGESEPQGNGSYSTELTALNNTISNMTMQSIELKPLMPIGEQFLLVLSDSLTIYDIGFQADVILLTKHPKVNIARVLSYHQPKEVVLHNSMPLWFKEKCIETCIKNNIPFHDISEKGYWSKLFKSD
ncbi:ComEC/Rec2 family competence protein [Myroides phaeus]|uniref:ComEC/Rec2 family competence protein n=1 Tax=Myroides phaeus TaxID=702745 RepID=UPI001303C606|nr:ComEC/Rec2 family competence protein [Myroides phaeus]